MGSWYGIRVLGPQGDGALGRPGNIVFSVPAPKARERVVWGFREKDDMNVARMLYAGVGAGSRPVYHSNKVIPEVGVRGLAAGGLHLGPLPRQHAAEPRAAHGQYAVLLLS